MTELIVIHSVKQKRGN